MHSSRDLPRRLLMMTGAVALLAPLTVLADPCLIVYPQGETIYHYDVNEYYTVGPGHPLYDPVYDRGGQVLIELNTNEIAYNVYQAPGLAGFTPSTGGDEGYFIAENPFDLIVDGFHNEPTTFVNVLLVLETIPSNCMGPIILIDGNPPLWAPSIGWYYPLGDIVVQTPTPDGNNYSDTISVNIFYGVCEGLWLWAFSDENFNLERDGGECFTAFSHDTTVPVQPTTWGAIKAVYGE